MEEKILAKGEFSKSNAFITGATRGFIFGLVCFGMCFVLSLLIDFFSDPIVFGTWAAIEFVLFPLVFGISGMNLKRELVITDQKISVTLGKETLDFPLEAIISYSFRGQHLDLQAPPRKISAESLKNYEEISAVLNKLFNERKNSVVHNVQPAPVVINNSSNADELKKYKELLDMGAISQEEYDQKKKELLGL